MVKDHTDLFSCLTFFFSFYLNFILNSTSKQWSGESLPLKELAVSSVEFRGVKGRVSNCLCDADFVDPLSGAPGPLKTITKKQAVNMDPGPSLFTLLECPGLHLLACRINQDSAGYLSR